MSVKFWVFRYQINLLLKGFNVKETLQMFDTSYKFVYNIIEFLKLFEHQILVQYPNAQNEQEKV